MLSAAVEPLGIFDVVVALPVTPWSVADVPSRCVDNEAMFICECKNAADADPI